MDEDGKKPNEINPIRSVGCVVGYFIVGLVIYLFSLGFSRLKLVIH